jgi:hypothetical protein
MYIGGMDYACRTECFWWVIMGLEPCRVGLFSNISKDLVELDYVVIYLVLYLLYIGIGPFYHI